MKHDTSASLVGNPQNIVSGPSHAPSVATDHSLPFRHAMTEALLGTIIALAAVMGFLIATRVRDLSLWLWAGFIGCVFFAILLLKRYEDHVAYVRDDRRPEVLEADLDADGIPDRVHAVWHNNGAPAARPGTLAASYSIRFAEFVDACQRVGTTVRALRAAGFDDATQALFQTWLMHPRHPAAHWLSVNGHNSGWELAEEPTLRQVLRCTGWEAEA